MGLVLGVVDPWRNRKVGRQGAIGFQAIDSVLEKLNNFFFHTGGRLNRVDAVRWVGGTRHCRSGAGRQEAPIIAEPGVGLNVRGMADGD